MQSTRASSFEIETIADFRAALSILPGSHLGSQNRFDLNNRIFVFLVAFGAPLLGSFASIIVWVSLIWGIISLILRRFPFVWSRNDLAIGFCFALFAVVHSLSTLINSGVGGYEEIVPILIFFMPLILAPRFALSDGNRIFDLFVLGAGIGVICGALVGTFEALILDTRSSGLLGNPGILAIIGCATAGIGALNIKSTYKPRQLLGVLSLIAILPIVISTQMRALWPVAFVILIIFSATSWPRNLSRSKNVKLAFGLTAIVTLIIAAGWPTIEKRIENTYSNFNMAVDAGNYNTSIGKRFLMWDASIEAIAEKPLLGYGMVNRMEVVREISLREHPDIGLGYSHAHNAALTALLDAGIPGLLTWIIILFAPIALALKRREPIVSTYFIVIALAYFGSGLTGIMFHHDLTDSFYVIAIMAGMAKLAGSTQSGPA